MDNRFRVIAKETFKTCDLEINAKDIKDLAEIQRLTDPCRLASA